LGANLSNHDEQPPSPFYDNPDPLQPDSTDDSTGTSDPGDLDDHKQQDATLQAE